MGRPKKEKKFVDLKAIDPQLIGKYIEEYTKLDYELVLIKEQMKGMSEEYSEKYFGKDGIKTIQKAIRMIKANSDIDLIAYIMEKFGAVVEGDA